MRLLIPATVIAVALPAAAAITGSVVESDGTPIAKASVVAYAPLPGRPEARAIAARVPIATVTTDANGAFKLPTSRPQVVDLAIVAENHVPANSLIADGDSTGPIVLVAARVIERRITTADGKPLAGALILAEGQTARMWTRTDASGTFRLPNPALWARVITVVAPGYAAPMAAQLETDVVLPKMRDVQGRVVDAAGKPVAGADVVLNDYAAVKSAADGTFSVPGAEDRWMHGEAHASGAIAILSPTGSAPVVQLQPSAHIRGVVRDAHGAPVAGVALATPNNRYVAVTNEDGRYDLEADRTQRGIEPERPVVYSFAPQAVDLSAGDVRRDIVAQKLDAVYGKVIGDDGKPIPGASINAAGLEGSSTIGYTNAAGTFLVYADAAKTKQITARFQELPPASTELKPGALTLKLSQGVVITGFVHDSAGKPIPNVSISTKAGFIGGPEMNGRFSLRVPAGETQLRFSSAEFGEKRVDVTATKPLDVTLARWVEVAGRVVDDAGKPVLGVGVALGDDRYYSGEDGRFHFGHVPEGSGTIRFGASLAQTMPITAPANDVTLVLSPMLTVRGQVIDEATKRPVTEFTVTGMHAVESKNGEFETEVPAGADLTVTAPGYVIAKVVPHLRGDALTVTLRRGRVITGHILTANGDPIEGAQVLDADRVNAESYQGTRTDKEGRFTIEGTAGDRLVTLRIGKDGFVPLVRMLKPREDTIDVKLPRAVVVIGHVVDANGNPVDGAEVEASSATHDAPNATAYTDATGTFTMKELGHARYDFSAASDGNGRAEVRDVDVEAVRDIRIALEKMRTTTIVGHVSGIAKGAKAVVVAHSNVDDDDGRSEVDAAGNFRITNAPAGLVNVVGMMMKTIGDPLETTKSVSVDAKADTETRVDLAFVPRVVVRGAVNYRKKPWQGFTVTFSGDGGTEAETDANGHYEALLEPGEYDVTTRWSAYRWRFPATRHITVRDAMTLDLEVVDLLLPVRVVDAETSEPLEGAGIEAYRGKEEYFVIGADKDGRAAVVIEPGVPVTIRGYKEGYVFAYQDVTPDANPSEVTIRLKRATDLRVRVVDARDGRSLAAVAVARDAAGRTVSMSGSWIHQDGTLSLAVVPGRYDISASAEGYGSATVSAVAGSEEIRIPLRRDAKLLLRSSADLRGTARLIQPNGAEYVRCWCNGVATIELAGRATLVDRIAPGQYTLEVTPANGKTRRVAVTAVEGQTVSVSID